MTSTSSTVMRAFPGMLEIGDETVPATVVFSDGSVSLIVAEDRVGSWPDPEVEFVAVEGGGFEIRAEKDSIRFLPDRSTDFGAFIASPKEQSSPDLGLGPEPTDLPVDPFSPLEETEPEEVSSLDLDPPPLLDDQLEEPTGDETDEPGIMVEEADEYFAAGLAGPADSSSEAPPRFERAGSTSAQPPPAVDLPPEPPPSPRESSDADTVGPDGTEPADDQQPTEQPADGSTALGRFLRGETPEHGDLGTVPEELEEPATAPPPDVDLAVEDPALAHPGEPVPPEDPALAHPGEPVPPEEPEARSSGEDGAGASPEGDADFDPAGDPAVSGDGPGPMAMLLGKARSLLHPEGEPAPADQAGEEVAEPGDDSHDLKQWALVGAGGVVVMAIVAMVVWGLVSMLGGEDPAAAGEPAVAPTTAPAPAPTIPATTPATSPPLTTVPVENREAAEEFVGEWNDLARDYAYHLTISAESLPISTAPAATVHLDYGEDGVLELMMAPKGNGNDRDILVAMGLAVAWGDPSLSPEGRKELLGAMGVDVDDPQVGEMGGELSRNGVDYSTAVDDGIIRFRVDPAR